jgi:hypothetical protein
LDSTGVTPAVRQFIETAWQLPSEYFEQELDHHGGFGYVQLMRDRISGMLYQQPLSRIMHGGHEHTPLEVREAMWKTTWYRETVAHVFSKHSNGGVLDAAARLGEGGYWGPVYNTMVRAVAEGLVGVPTCRERGPMYELIYEEVACS